MPGHGRYTVVRKIADGGMAEIFLGRQHGAEGFERPVVLKRILTAFYADPHFRNLLIDEAHVAMSLLHSNIVQVLDLGQAEGRYFLVLELVDGWDLNQIVRRSQAAGSPLPAEIALYVVAEVCRALHYAHSKTKDGKTLGIVHRDVSPHNVLVSEQGEVKLTDFGIAKALGKRDRTGTGVIKGKLAFMSPEQASGAVLDRRSDLFSAGTMLYLMACGRKPFQAPTELEAMLRIQHADFPAPETVMPGTAGELATVIKKAMRLLPSERYQTAEEMLEDIERVQRAAFKPAGQTELKRWLADLSKKDGLPPLTRQKAPPASRDASTESVDGLDLVLEEPGPDGTGAGVGATVALATPPPVAAPEASAIPAPGPTGPGTQIERRGSAGGAAAAAEGARKPGRAGFRAALALALVAAAAAAGIYLVEAGDAPGNAPRVTPAVRVSRRGAADPLPKPATLPPSAARTAARLGPPEPTRDAAPERPSGDGDGPAAVDAKETGQAAVEEPGEDELLRQADKGAADGVIGGGEPGADGRPASATVSVKISSRPSGAVVRVGHKVLGRTPIDLRFRPGIVYDVTFVKTDYQTLTKRLEVGAKRKQALAVALRKKPPPPRSKGMLRKLFPDKPERGRR